MGSVQPQRKISQLLLLSVSVFSFIFSYSLWCSSLVYSFKQIVAHALNKNCIFLLFNGLLVFLARTSGLVHSRSGFDLNDLLQKNIGEGLQTVSINHEEESSSSVESLLENSATAMENRGLSSLEKGEHEQGLEPEGEEGNYLNLNEEQDCKKEDDEEEVFDLIAFDQEQDYNGEEEEDDDDHDGEGESTEELNKKFEDFIRRMKEEIKTTT